VDDAGEWVPDVIGTEEEGGVKLSIKPGEIRTTDNRMRQTTSFMRPPFEDGLIMKQTGWSTISAILV
jgi:hypothetical protein